MSSHQLAVRVVVGVHSLPMRCEAIHPSSLLNLRPSAQRNGSGSWLGRLWHDERSFVWHGDDRWREFWPTDDEQTRRMKIWFTFVSIRTAQYMWLCMQSGSQSRVRTFFDACAVRIPPVPPKPVRGHSGGR
jgi:hypothetical protein